MMDIGPTHVGVVLRDPKGELGKDIAAALKQKKPLQLQSKSKKTFSHPFPNCNEWLRSMPAIITAFQMAAANGTATKFDIWLYCPWCKREIVQNLV